MENNKEKSRRYVFYAIFLVSLSLIIGCSTLVFSGGTSGTSSASLTTSNASSSVSPSSTSTTSSSSATTSSSNTSSNGTSSQSPSSSSVSSSENLNGARLNLLQPVGDLVVFGGIQIESTDYFVTKDDNQVFLSGFSGNNLLFKNLIGDVNTFFMLPIEVAFTAYHEGFLFSYYANFAPETVYVTATGVEDTFENVQILPSTSSMREVGLYGIDSTTGNELIEFVSPNLTPTKLADLTSTMRYSYVTDEYINTQMTTAVAIPETFFTLMGFDTTSNQMKYEFFNRDTFTLILDYSLQAGAMSGKELLVTTQGLTILDMMQLKVTHYDADGVDYELTSVFPVSFPSAQSFIVKQQMTNEISVYINSVFIETLGNGSLFPMTNNEVDGASFVVNYVDGSSGVYAIEDTLIDLFFSSISETVVVNYSNVPDQAISYDTASNSSTVILYSLTAYGDSNYVDSTMFGDIRNEPIQYVANTQDFIFLVRFVEGEPVDPDNVLVSTNPGGQSNNFTIENKNIVNLRDVGYVDEFVVFNAAIGSTSNYKGIVVNITDGTIFELTDDLTFITPQMGDSILTTLIREGNSIHAYGPRGIATINLDTLTVTREVNITDDSATVSYDIKEGILDDDATLVIKYVEPFPNSNFVATITLFSANLNEGFGDFELLGEGQIDTLSISNSLFALTEEGLLQINRTTQQMYSIFGDDILAAIPFYLFNQTYYVLTDTYQEINTFISEEQTFTLF